VPFIKKIMGTNKVEGLGILCSLLGVYFSAKQARVAWIWNILASAMYGYIFYGLGLFSDMELQGFFILMAIFGFFQWTRSAENWIPEKSTRMQLIRGLLASLVFGGISGYLHQRYVPNVSFPYLDACLTGLSIWGTYLAAKRKIENWVLWILVDFVYIGMYMQKGIAGTSALYGLFICMAFYGYRSWQKKMS
jgi:nicotinamide mononucleotide transporter